MKAKGDADAAAFVAGVQALGAQAFTSVQLATVLATHGVKIVPDVSVGAGGAAEAVLGRLLAGSGGLAERLPTVTKNGTATVVG